MPRRGYSTRRGYYDYTPEEEAAAAAKEAADQIRKDAEAAEKARLQELRANEFVTQIEDAMRGKTLAEISAFIDGMTPPQQDRAFKALLLKWALEVK